MDGPAPALDQAQAPFPRSFPNICCRYGNSRTREGIFVTGSSAYCGRCDRRLFLPKAVSSGQIPQSNGAIGGAAPQNGRGSGSTISAGGNGGEARDFASMATQGALEDELVFVALVMPRSKHAIVAATNDLARLLGTVMWRHETYLDRKN
eukprot:scaffold103088_cov26-Attheya_sp.AAC.2